MLTIKGDLIELAKQGHFRAIAHGCNCIHVMGGGIAKQIKEQFPAAYIADLATPPSIIKLGTWTMAHISVNIEEENDEGLIDFGTYNFDVLNLYTQKYPSGTTDVFEYDAFERICRELNILYKGQNIGFPEIGCGLARGDKNRIFDIIKHSFNQTQVIVVEYHK